jgi:hypothetical protein
MSSMKFLAALLFPVSIFGVCTPGGEPWRWNSQLRNVCFENGVGRNIFPSPDRQKSVVAEHDGFHVEVNNRTFDLPGKANETFYPSEVAWAPGSSGFFINNGNGSGTDGWTLQVFRTDNLSISPAADFNRMLVAAFRSTLHCSAEAADPNVRGLGWSEDGSHLMVLLQATVHQSCGPQGTVRGAVLNLSAGTIQHFYGEADTRILFRLILPFNLR